MKLEKSQQKGKEILTKEIILLKPCSSVSKTKESSLSLALMPIVVENDSTLTHHRENYQKHKPGRTKAPWEKVQGQIFKTINIEHAF